MGVLQATLVLDFHGAKGGLAFHPVLQRHEFLAAHNLCGFSLSVTSFGVFEVEIFKSALRCHLIYVLRDFISLNTADVPFL